MVRSKPGNFIKEYNRINVALTRAKHGLVVIGNKSVLCTDEKWARLLKDHSRNVVEGFEGARNWLERQKVQYLQEILNAQ